MSALKDRNFKRDLMKLALLAVTLLGSAAIFFMTPALSTPTSISIVISVLLSPVIIALERRGMKRSRSVMFIFVLSTVTFGVLGVWAVQKTTLEWDTFSQKVPQYFDQSVARLREFEGEMKAKAPILEGISPSNSIQEWGSSTAQWFLVSGPKLMGDLFTWLFVVPILTFFLLKDGYSIRRKILDLVPNRFFESTFMVSTKILNGLSDYIRAKLVEAFMMGFMVLTGLLVIGAPYAVLLGFIAGITNIIPYLGPILGAVPALLIFGLDPTQTHLLLPVAVVFGVANLLDMAVIFPVMVAKIVNLHPLLLIVAVIVGQHYYGLVGMLISIPIATSIKVIAQEIFELIYERYKLKASQNAPSLAQLE